MYNFVMRMQKLDITTQRVLRSKTMQNFGEGTQNIPQDDANVLQENAKVFLILYTL